jgi:16S rRNA (cytosine967-C5)-methyltransferase
MMKAVHAPVWNGMVHALRDIFEGGFLADKVIQRQMKANRKWGSGDRRLFAETVYDMVRWWHRLLYAMGEDIPAKGAVFEGAVSAWCALQGLELGKGVPPPAQSLERLKDFWAKPPTRSVRESLPSWLDARAEAELGSRWEELLPVLNSVAPVYLRANRLKTTPEKLSSLLSAEKYECKKLEGDALLLTRRANVFLSKAFQTGLFEMQDLNSQKVALALDPQPGERIIDACAGAGGKTLHIAALMGGKGRIIALDVAEKKLSNLKERTARAGAASSVEVRLIENSKTIKRLHDSADRLLLDVPCSGMGVWRRNPDAKYRLSAAELDRLQGLQREILANYSLMCRPGGRLVFSTCSILPSENERQIEAFLAAQSGRWKVLSQETLWPVANGPDGFFISVLERG